MQRARTPEELETLMEDAFVTSDRDTLVELFEERGVLEAALGVARGTQQISRLATTLLRRDYSYLAAPRHVVQLRDTALVVGRQATNVARRGSDGGWLYAISLLDVPTTKGEGR